MEILRCGEDWISHSDMRNGTAVSHSDDKEREEVSFVLHGEVSCRCVKLRDGGRRF